MSSIYLTEPPTHGKVLLHTSFGDIDIELWGKECPKACRNFVQLAMEGYYDNTVFHRVIRQFMVQGGDPTGTGKGGESIYGKPFRDEIHTRIKFNHRGQVAMANENEPGTNHSQFFFTLDKAPHLDKKHTIFGKITGNTIFNALRMGDIDADKDDRPLDPPRLISVEVLLNPFDDIVPRGGVKSAHDALDDEKLSKDAAYDAEAVRRAGKGDAAVTTEEGLRKAVKSASKGGGKGTRDEGEGRSNGAAAKEVEGAAHPEGFDDGDAFMQKMRQRMMEKRKALEKSKSSDKRGKKNGGGYGGDTGWAAGDADDETEKEKARRKAIKERAKEFESLREEMKAKHRAARVMTGEERTKYDAEHMHREMISPVEQMRAKYKKRRKEAGTREDSTMAKLAAFTSLAGPVRRDETGSKRVPDHDTQQTSQVEAYHGQVTEGKLYEGDDDADNGEDWFTGPLKFKRHIDDDLRKGSDGRRADDYAVIDPLKQPQQQQQQQRRGG
ncbi:unnamed protein product, partial [Scytosiphon promiscuus]